MAERVYRMVRSFGRGMASLGFGWNWRCHSSPVKTRRVDYYFMRVGDRLIRARRRFEDQYLGRSTNVNV